jgi:hypothetical protein
MDLCFQRPEHVDAPPRGTCGALTDYEANPRIDPCVSSVRVLHRDTLGATAPADGRTCIERHVQFAVSCAPLPLLQLERRYASNAAAVSARTVEPAFGGRSYFTTAVQVMLPGAPGTLLRPVLWVMFNQLNFAPFLHAARAWSSSSNARGPVS